MVSQQIKDKIIMMSRMYPKKRSALIPALDLAQKNNNNQLLNEDIDEIAQLLGLTKNVGFGVASFYTMFNLNKIGKYHLQVDTNIPAFLSGAEEIFAHLENKLGIKNGQTTNDGLFTLTKVEDLASCGTCPVIQVNDTYYENLTIKKVDELIDSLKKDKIPEPDTQSYFKTECNILLKNRGKSNATDISTYQKGGGYLALKKALVLKPAQIIEMVKDSMIKGRGGAGFPAGTKWSFLPKDDPRPVYLICNADEGEPGTFKDRQIMQYDPHLLIEGIAITAFAINAKKAFIYIRGEFRWISEILEKAVDQAKEKRLLDHVDIIVHVGAGSYVCGDETALMESLEGKRGNPRVKPPFPANVGLYGCPTVINNVETLACIPYIVENGPQAFKKIGVTGNYGPKLFGISGHVNKPGIFEFPLGTSLDKIIDAAGGVKGKMKAVIVGGLSVPILKAEEAKGLKMDFDSCLKAGTMLGSAGIIVINDTISIPELTLRTTKFYAHESCGQCVPCREGTNIVKEKLDKIVAGKGSRKDFDLVLEITNNIQGLTLCPLGDAFAVPVASMVSKFREEFEALIPA